MNKAYNDEELEFGEIVQRDVPEIASRPLGIKIFYEDKRGEPPEKKKKVKVRDVSGLPYIIYGLMALIVIQCIFMGFLYSGVNESKYVISELNGSYNQRMQRIEGINNEIGRKINELDESINYRLEEMNKKVNQRIEEIIQLPQPTNGIIELDKGRYSIGEVANVIVKDADMNTNIRGRDTVGIIIKSIQKEQQIAISLVEITENSGVFAGKFVIMKNTEEFVPAIGVNVNDTIIAVYYDERTITSKPCNIIASANVTEVKV